MSIPSEQALWQMGKSADEWLEEHDKEIYNQALEDFKKALEKHQQENWIDNLEYGITFDDVEEVIKQLKIIKIF